MGISFNLADAVSGLLAKILGSGVAAQTTDNALVVMHRPDDVLAQPFTFVTGQGGQLALGQNIILPSAGAGSYDTGANRSASIEIVPAAGTISAGTIIFEGCNDDANWVPVTLYDRANPAAAPVSSYNLVAATPRYFAGDMLWKKFRARISTGITGTTTGVQCFALFSQQDYTPSIFQVRLSDGTNVGPVGDAAARGIYVRPTDGTSAQTMKAASTPAAAADIGAVVSLSPNLPAVTMYSVLSAATTNAANIKASAGKLLSLSLFNASAAIKYVRLFNLAVAPTMGTSTPYLVIAIPATSSKEIEFGTLGLNFSTGISIAITNAAADLDATVVAAGDVRVLAGYI